MISDRNVVFLLLMSIAIGAIILFYFFKKHVVINRVYKNIGLESKEFSGEGVNNVLDELYAYVPKFLSKNKDDIEDSFDKAGMYKSRIPKWYMAIKYLLTAGGAIFIYFYLNETQSISKVSAVIILWSVCCIIVPDLYLNSRIKSLQKKISSQLPYLLDLMSVCVQTGMTIESSLDYLTKELQGFDKDLSYIVRKLNERSKVVGLEKSLDELYKWLPTNEVRSFVMTLKQSLQYGSSIYSILNNLSTDIREVNMLSLEEKIGKLSAKMSIPLILFIMFPILVLIAAPGIMRLMYGVT